MTLKTNTELKSALIHEYNELLSKIHRLENMLERHDTRLLIGDMHFLLLNIQLKAMEAYAEVLFWRIRLVNDSP